MRRIVLASVTAILTVLLAFWALSPGGLNDRRKEDVFSREREDFPALDGLSARQSGIADVSFVGGAEEHGH